MSHSEYYYGVDFGTTNTAMVRIEKDFIREFKKLEKEPDYLGDVQGEPYPSLYGKEKNGNEILGREAWEKRFQLESNSRIVSSVKKILASEKRIKIGNKILTPVEITAKILESLKKENDIHNKTIEAVFSIPVGFTREKRIKLRKAARKAGIEIKSYVKESTAALFMYHKEIEYHDNILVFDWGGGTLDVSLLKNQRGKIKEMSTNSMDFAGDDIDRKIAKLIHTKLARKKEKNIAFEDMEAKYQDLLIVQCERAKRDLSIDDLTNITMMKYGEFGAVNEKIDIDLFEMLIENNINDAIELIVETINEAGISKTELDCLILIGGTSKIRPVQREIDRKFNEQEIIFPNNSEWKCAEGAALLSFNPGTYKLNQNIGLILSDDSFFPLYKKDQKTSDKKRIYEFSLIDDSNYARFIFARKNDKTGKKNIIDYANVDSYGFLDERLKLEYFIDENLIFRAKIGSSKKPEEDNVYWEYNGLNFYYDITGILEG